MIKIKAYSQDHEQDVIGLITSIQQNEFGIPVTIEQQPDLKDIPNFYQKNKGNFWIATGEGRVVGTIGLLDIGNSQGALRKMFVDEMYRGKNHSVGQILLDELLVWAKTSSFKKIILGTTSKFLAAQRFYEKNNFIEIDKELLPMTFPVMIVDTKFYERKI